MLNHQLRPLPRACSCWVARQQAVTQSYQRLKEGGEAVCKEPGRGEGDLHSLRFTPFHSVSLRFTPFHSVSLRFTPFHSVSLVSLRFTPFHSVSLRFTAILDHIGHMQHICIHMGTLIWVPMVPHMPYFTP